MKMSAESQPPTFVMCCSVFGHHVDTVVKVVGFLLDAFVLVSSFLMFPKFEFNYFQDIFGFQLLTRGGVSLLHVLLI